MMVLLLVMSQFTANSSGFQGPLHSLISDYVATPKSATVPWVGFGMAMAGLLNRWRIIALSLAVLLDIAFAAERLLRGGALAFGNGPLIVLTGLALVALRRRGTVEINPALPGIAFGLLVIVATKVGDSWLRITAIVRPKVFDEYALLADHALAQPSWMFGRLVHAAGPVLGAGLHWVYIELPVAAMLVTVYQLRNVRTGGWPRHFLVPTFLLLALIGPVIYVLFPVVGPEFAFGDAGGGFQVGDYWPHSLPPVDLSPRAVAFDGQTPRNCMPSMHTAWALAVFIHSRHGPRWLRVGGTVWLVCTVAATLGFGYHYGVDLVAGAVLCLTVESALREPLRGRIWSRMGLVAFGATFLAVLLLCCRYLAEPMARHPLLFGPLIVGAMVIFSAAFHAAFFARPGAPMEARTLSVHSSFASVMTAGEASLCAETGPVGLSGGV
ncbi:phosphatase PAP2 family protein [Mycobacterium sp. 852002-51163_SCH5372311]|uniref:phosphatase PAP2 family protein n=1 Tax=Mycobacterium sp. 852002-51163_SCH5372311 TaxID=1834097 RepID=UPI0009ED01E0|nr:phosphatase PAP2 family protein [Mycobacterium sp. 852002-51163_SCH5372311]